MTLTLGDNDPRQRLDTIPITIYHFLLRLTSQFKGSCFYFDRTGPILPTNMVALTPNPHLPPHLRELCSILATGIVRLRCRTAEELARDAAQARADGETSLHFTAHQSGHADAPSRRHA